MTLRNALYTLPTDWPTTLKGLQLVPVSVTSEVMTLLSGPANQKAARVEHTGGPRALQGRRTQ